jgi:hypothetical protein
MENGHVGNDEPAMAHLFNEGVRARNRQAKRLAKRMAGAGSFGVVVVQGRQAQDRERVHSRDSLNVTVVVLQRNLTSIDERHRRGTEAKRHFAS